MAQVHTGTGIQPRKFAHPMLACEDTAATVALLIDTLGFRLSDDVGEGTLVFMRCNVDHHGLGIMPGPDQMHHHAWEVQSIADLSHLGDRVYEYGKRLLWGPVRHGVGNNIAAYFADPAGYALAHTTRLVPRLAARGEAARKAGDVWGAAADWNRALALAPDDLAILRRIAGLHASAGQSRSADNV